MVATANGSFIEASELPQVHGHTAFFWTMVALAALDIVLLFWLLNPVSKSANDFHSSRTVHASTTRNTLQDSANKPSPLGATTAIRVTPKLSGKRGTFTTVGYNGR